MIIIKGAQYQMNKKRKSFEITLISKNVVKIYDNDYISTNRLVHKNYRLNDIYKIIDFNKNIQDFYLKENNQFLYTKNFGEWTAYPSSSSINVSITTNYSFNKIKFLTREGLICKQETIYKQDSHVSSKRMKFITLIKSDFLEKYIDKMHMKKLPFSSSNFINKTIDNYEIVGKSEYEFEGTIYLSFAIDEIIV